MEDKEVRAKHWALNKGITDATMEAAWQNALEQGIPIVVNLARTGHQWWWITCSGPRCSD